MPLCRLPPSATPFHATHVSHNIGDDDDRRGRGAEESVRYEGPDGGEPAEMGLHVRAPRQGGGFRPRQPAGHSRAALPLPSTRAGTRDSGPVMRDAVVAGGTGSTSRRDEDAR